MGLLHQAAGVRLSHEGHSLSYSSDSSSDSSLADVATESHTLNDRWQIKAAHVGVF
jgi:hypothetical protein